MMSMQICKSSKLCKFSISCLITVGIMIARASNQKQPKGIRKNQQIIKMYSDHIVLMLWEGKNTIVIGKCGRMKKGTDRREEKPT